MSIPKKEVYFFDVGWEILLLSLKTILQVWDYEVHVTFVGIELYSEKRKPK